MFSVNKLGSDSICRGENKFDLLNKKLDIFSQKQIYFLLCKKTFLNLFYRCTIKSRYLLYMSKVLDRRTEQKVDQLQEL